MSSLSLSPVAAAVFAVLNVPMMAALVESRIYDDIPQAPTYPLVWLEVLERNIGGLGTAEYREVELRAHVLSQYEGLKEAQTITRTVIALLNDQVLTISGYAHCGRVFYDDTVPAPFATIEGVKVQELIAMFRIVVEGV